MQLSSFSAQMTCKLLRIWRWFGPSDSYSFISSPLKVFSDSLLQLKTVPDQSNITLFGQVPQAMTSTSETFITKRIIYHFPTFWKIASSWAANEQFFELCVSYVLVSYFTCEMQLAAPSVLPVLYLTLDYTTRDCKVFSEWTATLWTASFIQNY